MKKGDKRGQRAQDGTRGPRNVGYVCAAPSGRSRSERARVGEIGTTVQCHGTIQRVGQGQAPGGGLGGVAARRGYYGRWAASSAR